LPSDPALEFRPYRRALQGIVAFVSIAGILYLLASIAVSVFSKQQVHLRGAPIRGDDPAEVLGCQNDVERLFREINAQTFGLQAMAGQRDTDLAQQWEAFTRGWKREWAEVGQRCRFEELRDRGLGTDFDRLAYAHADLADLELKFAALLKRYVDDQVPHIEAIRRSLEASRRGLAARTRPEPPPQAGGVMNRR
jgi:hypothetical protein